MCNNCKEKDTCSFFEKDADECVYEALLPSVLFPENKNKEK